MEIMKTIDEREMQNKQTNKQKKKQKKTNKSRIEQGEQKL